MQRIRPATRVCEFTWTTVSLYFYLLLFIGFVGGKRKRGKDLRDYPLPSLNISSIKRIDRQIGPARLKEIHLDCRQTGKTATDKCAFHHTQDDVGRAAIKNKRAIDWRIKMVGPIRSTVLAQPGGPRAEAATTTNENAFLPRELLDALDLCVCSFCQINFSH